MKIASFSTNGYPSSQRRSLGIFTHEQAQAFQRQGIEVDVFDLAHYNNSLPQSQIEDYEGIRVHRVPPISLKSPLKSLRSLLYLRSVLNQGKHHTILCSFLDSQYFKYIPWIHSKQKLGFVVHGRDAMIPHGSLKSNLKRFLKRYLFKRADYCFPVSEYTETLLSCLVSRKDHDKIEVVYNGINREKFASLKDANKEELRAKYNIPLKNFVVITVCQLVERKGVAMLADGVLESLKEHNNITHIIVGNGPEKGKIQNKLKNSLYSDNFLFFSNIDNQTLAELYASANIYAMISKTLWNQLATEGFGISYAEASHLGLPVICGKDGGGTLAVQNNFTGYWVNPHDPNCHLEIAKRINKLITSPEEYERISANGIIYTKDEFSWDQNAKKIASALSNN